MPDYYSQINMLVAPTLPGHVARLADVSGLYSAHFKLPVMAATAADLGGTYDVSPKTLTAGANGSLTVDGVAMYAGDRVLVKDQSAGYQNGVYSVTDPGSGAGPWVLTRADDFDDSAKIYSAVKVTAAKGATNDNRTFILATDPPIILDSTVLVFVEDASGGGSAPPTVAQYVGSMQSGDPATKSITHALGTLNVTVDVFRVADGASVIADVTRPDVNHVNVAFAAPPTETFTVLIRAV
jgi:hypothetical protein